MRINRTLTLRRALLGASSLTLAVTGATAAQAQTDDMHVMERPGGSEEYSGIVIRNDLNPNTAPPSGVLDSGINGVGQMTVRASPTTTSMGVCTGTLINPRTVIFAAHCVNTRPAEAYGPNGTAFGAHSGGTPIAFGFNADNLPAVRQWLGLDGGTAGATNIAQALYAVEQVWYDPRSKEAASCTSATSCFLQADVAIATLDTPARDIPTWAMLFSPLDGPTHATITGYGNRGNENSATIAIDWRRRSAENMIAVLGSLNDRNSWIFGSPHQATNNLYLFDFRDPNPGYNPAAGKFDFGIYGSAEALPREGTTAGGDSGGPLIVDQKYDRPVVAAVLSGGTRYFAAQSGHRYGTDSFYQPLHLYWDVIVANNPYVYAGNTEGDGDWEDGSHWVQLMDPNYMIDVGGELVNGLPDTPAQGTAPGGAKFGQICFLDDCTTLSGTQATGDGTAVFIPGGPGSTGFVPDNVSANPAAGVRARYYDVTLSAAGTTSLGSSVTIDRMTLDGYTRLDVKNEGTLNVLGEYNQFQGWTNVDGRIQSGGDMMVLSGMLSGSGTVNAPFLTVIGGIVAPAGGDRIGTLTVDGDMIMASASSLFIDASRAGADRLAVTGELALGGGSLVFNKSGPAPRHGDRFDIATANLVTGTFGNVYSFQGVLRPEIIYSDQAVTAHLRAGSLVTILDGQNPTALAFANALDQLRSTSYNSLYGLYGAIDLMDAQTLTSTLANLAPASMSATRSLEARQSRVMLNNVSDRLSMLGTGPTGTMSMNGATPAIASALAAGQSPTAIGLQSLRPSGRTLQGLPKGMTGFVSSGIIESGGPAGRASLSGQQGWYASSGLEMEMAPNLTFGTAFGLAESRSQPGQVESSDARTTQVAAYGSYRLGDGVYVAGLASADISRSNMQRRAATGNLAFDVFGATNSSRYNVTAEAGVNLDAGAGLLLTPRVSLSYSSYQMGGFREQGGDAALAVDDLRLQQLEARAGAKLGGQARLGSWSLQPQLQGDFVQIVGGANDGMQVRFANAGDLAFNLPLANGDSSWAEVRGGLRLTRGRVGFGAGVEASIGRSGAQDQRAVADFAIRF